jgi:hypothetical protein
MVLFVCGQMENWGYLEVGKRLALQVGGKRELVVGGVENRMVTICRFVSNQIII